MHQNANEGVNHGLRHRPSEHGRVNAIAGCVALSDDAPLVNDDDRLRRAIGRLTPFCEDLVERCSQLRVGRLDNAGADPL